MLLDLHGHDAWEQSSKNSIPNGGERRCRFQLIMVEIHQDTGEWYNGSLRPRKTNMAGWKIPILYRKFEIHLHSCLIFQPVMLVSLGCISFPFAPIFSNFLGIFPWFSTPKPFDDITPVGLTSILERGTLHLTMENKSVGSRICMLHPANIQNPEYPTFKLIGSILSYQVLTSPLKTTPKQQIHFIVADSNHHKIHPP